MRVNFCIPCLDFVFVFAGEKEGEMDPKGDERVPRVRGEGGRLQSQAPRVQPSQCEVLLDAGGAEDPGQVRP